MGIACAAEWFQAIFICMDIQFLVCYARRAEFIQPIWMGGGWLLAEQVRPYEMRKHIICRAEFIRPTGPWLEGS